MHAPFFVFNINDFSLQIQTDDRDLGVDIDTSLRFHRHISSISTKSLNLNILGGTVCRTSKFIKQIFIAHVQQLLVKIGFIADLKS